MLKDLARVIRIRRLNQKGFDHVVILVLFVVAFGLFGSAYLIYSHALSYDQVRAYSATSPTCLANDGDSSANGTPVIMWTCNGNPGGTYFARSGNLIESGAGNCLDDLGQSKVQGTQVRLEKCSSTDPAQQWVAFGTHQFKNPGSGLCLDDSRGSATNGTKVDVYGCKTSGMSNQEWYFEPLGSPIVNPSADKQIHLYTATSASCLDNWGDSPTNGGYVKLDACAGTPGGSLWTIHEEAGGFYEIQSAAGNVCVTAPTGSVSGTPLRLDTCVNNNSDMWKYYTTNQLANAENGYCMDDQGGSSANGATIDLFACKTSGLTNQEFFVPGATQITILNAGNCVGQANSNNDCYYHTGASQNGITASGVSANLYQADPVVPKDASGFPNHSVMEIWVENVNDYATIEFGWDAEVGDPSQLFASHWVNGIDQASTGYVAVDKSITTTGFAYAGLDYDVKAGTTGNYKIIYANSEWQFWYNNTEIGYFPESLWTSQGFTFTNIDQVMVFGETVESSTSKDAVPMGNGILGNKSGAAYYNGYTLYGSTSSPNLSEIFSDSSNTSYYTYGNATATSMSVGGPGE
jgi:hypothetical protein